MGNKILMIIILFIVFTYGVLVGTNKVFPFNEIRMLKIAILGPSVKLDNEYLHRKTLFEVLSKDNSEKIVMLGDSLTDMAEWNELSNRNNIINRGISGDTTDGLLKRLDSLNGVSKVFIMIGRNDFNSGKSVEYIFSNYKKIIEILKEKNIEPYIQSILYAGTNNTLKMYNKDIISLNSLLLNYADRNKIIFIDLNNALTQEGFLNNKYSFDGIHLNGKGYSVWMNEIKKYLK